MKLGLFHNKIRAFLRHNLKLFNIFNNKKNVLSKQKIVSIVSIVFKTFVARMA